MKNPEQLLDEASRWWDTSIIDIHPGKIAIRGYPIEQLIGRVRFPEMIWLMLRGELPTPAQSELLEASARAGVQREYHRRLRCHRRQGGKNAPESLGRVGVFGAMHRREDVRSGVQAGPREDRALLGGSRRQVEH